MNCTLPLTLTERSLQSLVQVQALKLVVMLNVDPVFFRGDYSRFAHNQVERVIDMSKESSGLKRGERRGVRKSIGLEQ